jgi:hypothetical protein
MSKINIIALLLFFLFSTRGYSPNIPNGYYNCIDRNGMYIYVHNDTIILPFANGMMYVAIRKGVIDKKRKWINFIPILIQERSPYAVYDNKKQKRMKFKYFEEGQRIEILFNLPFNNYWNKYEKTEEPQYKGRSQPAIEKHINDMLSSMSGI